MRFGRKESVESGSFPEKGYREDAISGTWVKETGAIREFDRNKMSKAGEKGDNYRKVEEKALSGVMEVGDLYEQLRKKKRRSRTVTRYRRLLKRFGIVLKGNFNVDFFVSLNLSIQFVLTHRSNPFSAKILLQAPSTDPLNNGYMR
ncbi:hypothetical protein N7465_001043 [Penicillium sp. CMV-2018d]|nr:hypothetical protein N7465_001043 [Penicillium sp. CMV-2018d]